MGLDQPPKGELPGMPKPELGKPDGQLPKPGTGRSAQERDANQAGRVQHEAAENAPGERVA